MLNSLKRSIKCSACGARLPHEAVLCPACGQKITQKKQSEQCPACGARMLATQESCPICGAQRQMESALPGISLQAIVSGVLALGALAVVVWLIRPQADLATALAATSTPSVTITVHQTARPSATASVTPSPRPSRTPTMTSTHTATVAPSETPSPLTYTVVRGDNPASIAAQFGISVEELYALNSLNERSLLQIGQVLIISLPGQGGNDPTAAPEADSAQKHVVAEGENLFLIANKYGLSTAALADANQMETDDLLSVGQELIIPDEGAQATEAPAATPTNTPEPTATPTATFTLTPEPTPSPTMTPGITPSPRASPTQAKVIHVVERGETLGAIAVQYDIAAEEIARANGIEVDAILRVGQELIIPQQPIAEANLAVANSASAGTAEPSATPRPTPTKVIHIVQKGENLGIIAAEYDVSIEEIARASGIQPGAVLNIGQELVIPVATPEPEPTAEPTATPTATSTATAAATAAASATEPSPTATAIATATPDATPTPAPTVLLTTTHTVGKGETLGAIALQYDVAPEEIAQANDMKLNAVLRIDQQLIIPLGYATVTPAPSPTPLPVTATPQSVVSAATKTPIARGTASPTPTPTPVMDYVQPHLLAPTNSSIFSGPNKRIMLNWASVGILEEDEWYTLRVWRTKETGNVTEVRIKGTSWRMPAELYPKEGEPNAFLWQVTVEKYDAASATFVAISPVSKLHWFRWE